MATMARLLDLGVRPYREVLRSAAPAARGRPRRPRARYLDRRRASAGHHAGTDGQAREFAALCPTSWLARGVDVVEIERGGDVTYHGPGQLVVYPIRRMERFREIVPLVRALEGAVIDVCARFGVAAERWSEHAGVWVGHDQICAIGLAVRKMISLHGIALNVSTELDYDRLIKPCGLIDRGITSLSEETGRFVGVAEAKDVLLEELAGRSTSNACPRDDRRRRSHRDRSRRSAEIRAQAGLAARFAAGR